MKLDLYFPCPSGDTHALCSTIVLNNYKPYLQTGHLLPEHATTHSGFLGVHNRYYTLLYMFLIVALFNFF